MWRVRNNARGGLLRDGEGRQGIIRPVTKCGSVVARTLSFYRLSGLPSRRLQPTKFVSARAMVARAECRQHFWPGGHLGLAGGGGGADAAAEAAAVRRSDRFRRFDRSGGRRRVYAAPLLQRLRSGRRLLTVCYRRIALQRGRFVAAFVARRRRRAAASRSLQQAPRLDRFARMRRDYAGSLELGRVRRRCNGGMAMVLRQRQRRILGSRLRIARLLGRRRDVTLVYHPEQIKTSAGQICSDRCVLIATKK